MGRRAVDRGRASGLGEPLTKVPEGIEVSMALRIALMGLEEALLRAQIAVLQQRLTRGVS